MYVLSITKDYADFNSCTDETNEDNNIIIKYVLLSTPSSILLLCVNSLIIYTNIRPFLYKR